ncbi:MAG: amidase [Alphaproteobacteria bacterium]|nr:amidase [Alphaproteobacteria bacterium]
MTAAASLSEIPTIAEASRLIAKRALSPVELTKSLLDRIKAHDGRLNSFLLVTEERALADARAAEKEIAAGRSRGTLHGIPIAHKDIYSTKGIRTTAHSRLLADHVPKEDAATVRKLAEAGTVMLGKLATHEFAMGGPSFDLPWPPARNPWNTDHVTGGSSSGTGAAIAAGFILGGTGSDTGGSIRHPAAFCGVTGIKPTYGLCSRVGILPLAFSLDHAGPLAWTAEDCAILLQAMAGYDENDPASAKVAIPDFRAGLREDLRGVRIGLLRRFHETDLPVEPEMQKALDDALDVLRRLGAEVSDVSPPSLDLYTACSYLIGLSETFAIHAEDLGKRYDDYSEMFRDRVAIAALFSGPDYVNAQRLRRHLTEEMRRASAEVDVLLTASAPGGAPTFASTDKWAMFKKPGLSPVFNVTGQPVVTVCCGFSGKGLPLGIQIAGQAFGDATALAVGHAYQKATPWRDRRPHVRD